MENGFDASSSVASSSTASSSILASPSIQIVSKSDSERLLGKFFDASQYDFDYEQSSLWSPPIPARRVFLASPAGHSKLKKAKRACRRRFTGTAFGALQDDNLNWCHPRLNFFSKGMFLSQIPTPKLHREAFVKFTQHIYDTVLTNGVERGTLQVYGPAL
ncbi:hypothetical protein DKX38_017632 [Salix brachista]|uniref:Uncharacterized protein n=1 Tax=Salix brachista TaxID=2182728 RepID=A0A5N5KX48_9ROSI|nr:hypothetical protein DKX38_017632 [Salix brachista]